MKFFLYPLSTLLGVVLTAIMWVKLGHLENILVSTGISLNQWLTIDVIWTVASGFVAWGLSRDIAIWSTDTQLMDDSDSAHPLVLEVKALARDLGLSQVPQIGIYPSPEVNIFSAGPFPKRSVLSVSQGFCLLNKDDQKLFLLAELSKIKSLDTSLLVFCHGMTHGFVLYASRMLAFLLGTSFRQTEGSSSSTYPEIIVSSITTLCLTLWGSVVVFLLARKRHLRGDQALEKLLGRGAVERENAILKATAPQLEHYDLFTAALKANYRALFVSSYYR